jgi:hypothetical protein
MKVFLSWSGQRSRGAAEALRDWLPDVIQGVEPWMSKIDIEAGARWRQEVATELDASKFGILCLTPDNQSAPWILFEAGALAKTIPDTFVCPYLIDLSPTDLRAGPLTEFQAKRANKLETWEMVATINRARKEHALDETRLRRTYEKFWPDLEQKLGALPPEAQAPAPRRVEDMVEEILDLVRTLSRRPTLEYPEGLLSPAVWAAPVRRFLSDTTAPYDDVIDRSELFRSVVRRAREALEKSESSEAGLADEP